MSPRYVLLSHRLLYLCAQDADPGEDPFAALAAERLATDDEVAALRRHGLVRFRNGARSLALAEVPWMWTKDTIEYY